MVSYIDTLKSVEFEKDVPPSVWESFTETLKSLLLPEQIYGEDRPAQEEDFASFKTEVVFGFKVVSRLLHKFAISAVNQSFNHDTLVWLLILCGEHSFPNLWTTEETCQLSAKCLQSLCKIYGCSSTSELVVGLPPPGIHNPCFKHALLLLRPKLLKETWLKHPGAVASYKWLLMQVHSPHLSKHVDIVFPTALIIIDDHCEERRLDGLECLNHIIDNVARTELRQRGLHKVFYKTLESLLWQRNANLVEPSLLCLVKLLTATERGYTRSTEPGMWDLFDDTLGTLLDKMVLEDQINLRVAYIKSLGPLLAAKGPSVIRWSKPLLSVLDEYLHKESVHSRKCALETMKVYIGLSLPRMHENGDTILYLLLRTLQDLSTEAEEQEDSLSIIQECVSLVRDAAPKEFENVKQELGQLDCNSVMKSVLETFL